MSKLDTAQRNSLATSTFALPGRRYPINDPNHARAAISMSAKYASPLEQSLIQRKVAAKYPGIQ